MSRRGYPVEPVEVLEAEAAGEGTFHWQLARSVVVVGVASYTQVTLSPLIVPAPVWSLAVQLFCPLAMVAVPP